MKAIICDGFGDTDVLKLAELPTPAPAPGEVLIAVQAAGVNRADLLQRRGFYPPPAGISEIIGLEVAGRIAACGDQVSGWAVGDEVVAILAGGGYAEYAVAPAGQCIPLPPGLDAVAAASIVEVAATVVSNFDAAGLQAGQTCLIHGGAGGIGSFAIPYARTLGARVLTTAGSEAKLAYCRQLGAEAFDYHGDWVAAVQQATDGKGVDVILDIIGAKYLSDNITSLARNGHLIIIGLQGGRKAELDINKLLTKNAVLTATSLRFRPVAEKAAIMAALAERVWPLYASGQLPLPPVVTYPLAEAAAAHQYLDSGDHLGKVVLTV